MKDKDILNRLFVENNLTDKDYFKHKFYTIITRSGIDKIQAANDIKISYVKSVFKVMWVLSK